MKHEVENKTERRLRIQTVLVQPVLAWDDGNELTPGPQCDPIQVTVSGLVDVANSLPAQVQELEDKLLEAADD
jgi:hypothetical protein